MAVWAIRGQGGERRGRREAGGGCPLIQVKRYNPADAEMGLPPLAAACRARDLHTAGVVWAKSLIDDAAKPSDALVYVGGGRITAGQFDGLKEDLAQSSAGGLWGELDEPFGEDVEVRLDLDGVLALSGERAASRARIAVADFQSTEEKPALAGVAS